jgi:hypothetical protein
MTNSALIVFLPLVGATLGAVVGGFVGAWANSWYRNREAKKAEDEERIGLLRLIDAEIFLNEIILTDFHANPDDDSLTGMNALRTNYWDSANIRLAQLMPADFTKGLVHYYDYILLAKVGTKYLEGRSERSSDDYSELAEGAVGAINAGQWVRRRGQQYLKDPDFLESVSVE